MTTTCAPAPNPLPNLRRMWTDAPAFTSTALLLTLSIAPTLTAMALDTRLFQNDNIWLKPLKFQLALAIYLITLAVFARFLPTPMTTRKWRNYAAVVCLAITAEILWVAGAAANGTASHFNQSTPIMAALYAVMGLLAVTLTTPTLVMGIAIWRNKTTGLPPPLHLSISLGLTLTFILTLAAAGTMSSGTGHLIGTPTTGTTLPILGWSREVGDLRAAHFFATHALHAIPLAGVIATRLLPPTLATRTVWAAAAAYTALIAALMIQALAGHPVI